MKNITLKLLQSTLLYTLFIYPAFGLPQAGVSLPTIQLEGDIGGRTDGTKWSSAMIKDQLWLLFYVDPDHKDDNLDLEKALKKENFPLEKVRSIAVINMAATWLPDAVLKSSLEAKQKDYPHVVYVLDRKKVLVEKWQLADDNYNVMLIDKTGKILFFKEGVLGQKEIGGLIQTIRENMAGSH